MNNGFDSHAHLDAIQEIESVLAECRREMCGIISSSGDFNSSAKNLEIARANLGFVFATVGTSPERVGEGWEKTLALVEEKGVAGVGEIGLDKKWFSGEENWRKQVDCFNAFLDKAIEKSLPAVVHSRKAEPEVLEILFQKKAERVLLHCFSGSMQLAENALAKGYLFSIPPQASRSRSEIARKIPLESLLVESDAPYMGKKPIDILMSAQIIAREKNLEVEKVLAETAANAKNFFRLV